MSDDPTRFLLEHWPTTQVDLTDDEVDDPAAIQAKMVEQAVSDAIEDDQR